MTLLITIIEFRCAAVFPHDECTLPQCSTPPLNLTFCNVFYAGCALGQFLCWDSRSRRCLVRFLVGRIAEAALTNPCDIFRIGQLFSFQYLHPKVVSVSVDKGHVRHWSKVVQRTVVPSVNFPRQMISPLSLNDKSIWHKGGCSELQSRRERS